MAETLSLRVVRTIDNSSTTDDTKHDTLQSGVTVADVTGNSGGTANGALVDSTVVVTGVDGTANNAASKVDTDARLVTIADNIDELRVTQIAIQSALRRYGIIL